MNLAIIPARGGSVVIPGKNLVEVAGKSLLAWSIEAAFGASLVDRVVVSTDAPAIAGAAAMLGAEVSWRPAELATSTASLDAALLDCIERLAFEGNVVVLQPTVPYRRPGLVDEVLRCLERTQADSVLTVSRLHFVWRGDGTQLVPTRSNRQEQPRGELLYHEDGAVFVFRAALLRATGCRVGGRVELIENGPSVDVDEAGDLNVAEALLRTLQTGYCDLT